MTLAYCLRCQKPLFFKQLPSCIFSGTRINFVSTRRRDKICINFFIRSLYVYFEVLKILVKAEKIHQNAANLKDNFMGKQQLLGKLTRNFLGFFWLTDSEINFLCCFSRGCGNFSREKQTFAQYKLNKFDEKHLLQIIFQTD